MHVSYQCSLLHHKASVFARGVHFVEQSFHENPVRKVLIITALLRNLQALQKRYKKPQTSKVEYINAYILPILCQLIICPQQLRFFHKLDTQSEKKYCLTICFTLFTTCLIINLKLIYYYIRFCALLLAAKALDDITEA